MSDLAMHVAKDGRESPGLVLVGIDEVGRGCLAGPVWACAYAFHPGTDRLAGLKDSKKLSPKKRESLKDPLQSCGWHGHGLVDSRGIDAVGIGPATFMAMHAALLKFQAVSGLDWSRLRVVIDGNVLPRGPEWAGLGLGKLSCLVKADDLVPAVSAASVLAKVERDSMMKLKSLRHPGYEFEKNFGYGSFEHMAAVADLGPSIIHRMSFAPMKHMGNMGIAHQAATPSAAPRP